MERVKCSLRDFLIGEQRLGDGWHRRRRLFNREISMRKAAFSVLSGRLAMAMMALLDALVAVRAGGAMVVRRPAIPVMGMVGPVSDMLVQMHVVVIENTVLVRAQHFVKREVERRQHFEPTEPKKAADHGAALGEMRSGGGVHAQRG